jgi:AcrR family transcriptional regulator
MPSHENQKKNSPAKAPRATPVSARGKETRARIVAAARMIYRTEGLTAIDTRKVAWMADVSIGTVYRYFDSAQDLIDEIDPAMREIEGKVRLLREVYNKKYDAELSWEMVKAIFLLE